MKTILIILTFVVFISCASKKNAGSTTNSQTQSTKIMNDSIAITASDTLPLIVQFYSIGEGVKQEPKLKMDNFIKDYEKILKQTIYYQVVHWGREGEFDACFRLSNLNIEQRNNFILELKKLFDEQSHVHVLENQTCNHIR